MNAGAKVGVGFNFYNTCNIEYADGILTIAGHEEAIDKMLEYIYNS